MIKHKHFKPNLKTFTIVFGYLIVALIVAEIIISTIIPMFNMLSHDSVKVVNVVTIMTGLAISALVPPIVAYILGNRSTRGKDSAMHQLNGILFVVLTYWLTSLFANVSHSYVSSLNIGVPPFVNTTIAFMVPVVLAIIVLIVLSLDFTRNHKQKKSAFDYLPYQSLLIGAAAIVSIVMPIIHYLQSTSLFSVFVAEGSIPMYGSSGGLGILITPAVYIILTLVAVVVLKKHHKSIVKRITLSTVGLTLAILFPYLAMTVLQIHPIGQAQIIAETIVQILLAVAVWVTYILIARRDKNV